MTIDLLNMNQDYGDQVLKGMQIEEAKEKSYIPVDDIFLLTYDDGYNDKDAEIMLITKKEIGKPLFSRGKKYTLDDLENRIGAPPGSDMYDDIVTSLFKIK